MGKQKAAKVPVSRIRQMADSLESSAGSARSAGNIFMKGAKNVEKREKKSGMKEVTTIHSGRLFSDASKTFNGSEDWKKHGQMFLNRAAHNTEKANRYRAVADKAEAAAKAKAAIGRDKPLPSSDGIISTITNKISELFK